MGPPGEPEGNLAKGQARADRLMAQLDGALDEMEAEQQPQPVNNPNGVDGGLELRVLTEASRLGLKVATVGFVRQRVPALGVVGSRARGFLQATKVIGEPAFSVPATAEFVLRQAAAVGVDLAAGADLGRLAAIEARFAGAYKEIAEHGFTSANRQRILAEDNALVGKPEFRGLGNDPMKLRAVILSELKLYKSRAREAQVAGSEIIGRVGLNIERALDVALTRRLEAELREADELGVGYAPSVLTAMLFDALTRTQAQLGALAARPGGTFDNSFWGIPRLLLAAPSK